MLLLTSLLSGNLSYAHVFLRKHLGHAPLLCSPGESRFPLNSRAKCPRFAGLGQRRNLLGTRTFRSRRSYAYFEGGDDTRAYNLPRKLH